MAEDEFENNVLKSLGEIQKTQEEHTEILKGIDVSLKVNSRFICGTLVHSLGEIEKEIGIDCPTDF